MSALLQPRQKLPTAFAARENLREKGQFWTPGWLAEIMASWVCKDGPEHLFDPAVGPGTFFVAARSIGYTGYFQGYELDASVLNQALDHGLTARDLTHVEPGDFIAAPVSILHPAIISNPPYVRHHRLDEAMKVRLRELSRNTLGFELDGRTGLHVFFFLKCLEMLEKGGRLVFLLPADVCESVSSSALWKRLAERFCIEAVIRFEGDACPFPGVDTNALVFCIRRAAPQQIITWMRVMQPEASAIMNGLETGKSCAGKVIVHHRDLEESIQTGLSREPRTGTQNGAKLRDFASVVRGVATGANEFFFLTSEQIREAGFEKKYFVRAIGRTRDCTNERLSQTALDKLDAEGRPTWLLNLGDQPKAVLPWNLQNYLEAGESEGLHQRALIRTRRPWYRMERRLPPALLFAYLGRRDCRFILNEARAIPLTGFLCVYPDTEEPSQIEKLWRALNHPLTLANLAYVGKSYGGGALKVEPRQLDQLLIPQEVLEEFDLVVESPTEVQTTFFEEPVPSANKNVQAPKSRKKSG